MQYKRCKLCGGGIESINRKHSLVECNMCGLIFSEKLYSQEELKDVYRNLYNAKDNAKYKVHSVDEFNQLKRGKVAVGHNRGRLIRKSIKKESSILEIGSGVGVVGAFLKKEYPGVEYEGIELDEEANRKAESLGLRVHQGDFRIMKSFNSEYDVIMMWEVLEHIQDIKSCLNLISDKLKKEGVFIFSVPNFDKRMNFSNCGDNIFQSPPPVHLNFFTKKTLLRIFTSDFFEVKNIRVKKFPYFSPFSRHFLKMVPRVLSGSYKGSTLYCVVKVRKE